MLELIGWNMQSDQERNELSKQKLKNNNSGVHKW